MISQANAEYYQWGDRCEGWHLVKHPDLSVIHERMPAGTSEVRHYHLRSRQFFFVLQGVATLKVAGQSYVLYPYQGLEVAPGTPHQILNQSEAPLEFLVISHPHSHGDRVVEHD